MAPMGVFPRGDKQMVVVMTLHIQEMILTKRKGLIQSQRKDTLSGRANTNDSSSSTVPVAGV